MLRHPWVAALLLGTVVTPAAVILAVPAPRPLDVVLAWPLVLMDSWIARRSSIDLVGAPIYQGSLIRVVALIVGILLTWVFYVLLARLVVWRVAAGRDGGT
jgi:hypothetical protein